MWAGTRLLHTPHLRSPQRTLFTSIKAALTPKLRPPQPRKVADQQSHHGRSRNDPYSWMENLADPHLPGYIQAENDYCRKFMRQHRFLHRVVLKEMKQKLATADHAGPLKTAAHGYEYYTTTSPYGLIYLRKPLGQGRHAPEQVLLNAGFLRSMNTSVRKVLLSPDHSIFAYNTEREGMEYGDLHLKDLDNRGRDETLEDVFNFVWANDHTVYYTMADTQLRPCQVFAHRLGTDQTEDRLVYEESDGTAFVDITSTKDSKYITINSNSLSSSEIRVVDATIVPEANTLLTPTLIEPRQHGVEYYVDHHHDSFYILTNADGATNFKLVKTPDAATGRAHWKNVITVAPTEKIEDVDLFQNHIVIYGRRDGLPMILCHDLKTQETHTVDLPMPFAVVSPGSNLAFDTSTLRFSLTSPFTHESTFEYDMTERKVKPVRVQLIRRFDKEKYTCTQIHVRSHDNKSIPVTLIHQKNLQMNGRNPVLMRSYGAYGITTDPEFRLEHFPLLERGWVIALAHVRGGSELGRDWYEDGKLGNKINSFKDFISVAEHLITTQLTSSNSLAAMGTSAGGLLVGAMAQMRPDLFKALVLRVPFVDPLSSMLNPDLPLTQIEYPEWGNPTTSQEAYDWIRQYAPYDNITSQPSPAVYVTAGMKDQRVPYWQPLKYMARRRELLGEATSVLKVDLDRGHFGGQGEQEARLSDTAEQVVFLISQVQTS
ncbi:hypothetical protein [Absidia glauca]|uniref:Prolyl endopeptidase n=1 Tax=Absidia glauca TaxID=4829 RepID=A0A168NI32_ABSGL|nr:hypothetical protein [Absidia glauca]